MLCIYTSTPTPFPLYSTTLYSRYVLGLQARTVTLGLVLADGPSGVALLAHVSAMLGATAAGLGLAVRTLAHVRCKHTCERCEQAQTTVITRSQ